MKKSIYFLMMLVGLAFTGCEPMEDIHEEIDAQIENKPIEGDVDYLLTEEDYEALDLSYGSFNSIDDARALIPGLLNTLFPVWGEGSLVDVTFDLYAPMSIEEYTVNESDYSEIGLSVNYFPTTSDITEFLEYQFPTAEEGSYVELTYDILADEIGYTIDAEDFDFIGDELAGDYPDPASSAAQYSNFDRREGRDAFWSEEMLLEAINVLLMERFEAVEGQKYNVSYAVYDGSAGTESMTVLYDGNSYVAAGGTMYEITDFDYELLGTEFAEEYPEPAESASNYTNFDRRESNDAYWSDEMLVEAFNFILAENFPSAVEGDTFDVSFEIYDGSPGTEIMSFVLQGGEFVIDESSSVSTIQTTTMFAYINGEWDEPLTLEAADYEEMGQSYPNFDDEEEALYKIEIFLEREFPYAEEGDVVALAYDFFSGGTSTEYANFEFEGGEWNYIPSVIQETLQFGHNGVTWEPDNTIRYTMTAADFELVGEALAEDYEDPAWSAGNYANFDRREGNRNYWSDEMLLEAVNVVLDNLDPNAEEGQQYVVLFEVYTGTAGIESLSVVKQNGEWVLNE